MKITKLKSLTLALVAGTALTAISPARAQLVDINPFFSLGDIMMGFKATGGTGSSTQVYVSLGLATEFRDTTGNFLNIVNVGSVLTSTYGANWFERDDLFFGTAGALTSNQFSAPVNGDPARTLYASRQRTEVGTPGSSGSTAWTIAGDTTMTAGATDILTMSTRFANDFTTRTATLPSSNVNSWVSNTSGTTDFRAFTGGVEANFGAGSFGSFGAAGAVEGAVDLYRVLATTSGANPTGTARLGSYEGTFTIDSDGDISFIAIPEPSAVALLLVAAGIAFFVIRRRNQKTSVQA